VVIYIYVRNECERETFFLLLVTLVTLQRLQGLRIRIADQVALLFILLVL
jgi:hypothetical protein